MRFYIYLLHFKTFYFICSLVHLGDVSLPYFIKHIITLDWTTFPILRLPDYLPLFDTDHKRVTGEVLSKREKHDTVQAGLNSSP